MNMKYITSVFEKNSRKIIEGEKAFEKGKETENQVLNLYPDSKGQCFEGFGGAFTDSAGYVYSHMSDEEKSTVIRQYFDEDEMNYCFGRIHLDSCDFAMEQYEAMADPTDYDMKSFSVERTKKYMIPMIEDVQKMTGKKIELMVSPWSPPAFMKSNNERSNGGSLKKECYGFWARYLCRYIKELRNIGLNIQRMSLQNEPKAKQTWDSCIYTAKEEKEFLKDYLYPTMQEQGLDDIEIYIWDHNKERIYERACEIIDEETTEMISGIAFHWYSGDHFEALELVQKKFPNKKLILSEACIEYSKYAEDDYLANAQKYAHDIIGNLNAGMTAFYDWNLILDEKGGPNHVKNFCASPYHYDLDKRKLNDNSTRWYIWHFSHFIKPGARKIGHSRYTEKLEMTAFENLDGEIVAIVLNTTECVMDAVIRLKNQETTLTIPAKSISTLQIAMK